jgi:hypothetical protein
MRLAPVKLAVLTFRAGKTISGIDAAMQPSTTN